jgi:fatty acid desaturase
MPFAGPAPAAPVTEGHPYGIPAPVRSGLEELRPRDDYAVLRRVIGERGLLDKHPGYYGLHALVLVGFFALICTCLALTGDARLRVLCALPAAFLFGQLGFFAHDAAHAQVFRTPRRNYLLSVVLFNLLLGGSRGWWTDKHNLHHGCPNQVGIDPDAEFSVLALSADQALAARGVPRLMMRYQAQLIIPLLFLEAINIHVHSIRFVLRRNLRNPGIEAVMLVVHYVLYLGAIPYFLGLSTGLLFIAVHQALLGLYLGAAFITNHIGMVVPQPQDGMDFLTSQVVTARNVRGRGVVDVAFGSLTCQIEHHLFPNMPRNRLRTAAPVVRAFCAERGIAYRETGLFAAYGEVLQHLATMAEIARRPRLQS